MFYEYGPWARGTLISMSGTSGKTARDEHAQHSGILVGLVQCCTGKQDPGTRKRFLVLLKSIAEMKTQNH